MHINSILSPDRGRTPAFHCGEVGSWVAALVGRGLAGPPADVITVKPAPRRTHTNTHPPRMLIHTLVLRLFSNSSKSDSVFSTCLTQRWPASSVFEIFIWFSVTFRATLESHVQRCSAAAIWMDFYCRSVSRTCLSQRSAGPRTSVSHFRQWR